MDRTLPTPLCHPLAWPRPLSRPNLVFPRRRTIPTPSVPALSIHAREIRREESWNGPWPRRSMLPIVSPLVPAVQPRRPWCTCSTTAITFCASTMFTVGRNGRSFDKENNKVPMDRKSHGVVASRYLRRVVGPKMGIQVDFVDMGTPNLPFQEGTKVSVDHQKGVSQTTVQCTCL
jgi:hypothetical protein